MILTVTRACNCRCSYCPTVKEGFPSLRPRDAARAIELCATRFGDGEVQLTGGEPLLEPATVHAAFEAARSEPQIRRILLCTNGLLLTPGWLRFLRAEPKAVLVVSLDGRPEDHDRHRRALAPSPAGAESLRSELAPLGRALRVVVTQTIAPDLAAHAADNFAYLLSLGFWRFKFLPVYYQRWSPRGLAALRAGLAAMAALIRARWQRNERLYVRNLFSWAATPLFNPGLVVDSDGQLYLSNAALASACPGLAARTRVGSLDHPPSALALAGRSRHLREWVAASLPPPIWQSTLAVDHELTRFCRGLYPAYVAYRRRRRQEQEVA